MPGGTAVSQSWPSFATRVLNTNVPPDDAGLHAVEFPVRLGGPQRLDDSLVGFWLYGDDGTTDWLSCYVPGVGASKGGVRPPAQDTITLCPAAGGGVAVPLTLLLDPRGSVHATTGVLPVTGITIPREHHPRASRRSTSRSPRARCSRHPTPRTCRWGCPGERRPVGVGHGRGLTPVGPVWQVATVADAPTTATLDYTPQRISEGWLVMRPIPAAPLTPADTATHDTQDRTEDGESQW